VAFQRRKQPPIGTKAPYPGFIQPALATKTERVPRGERWVHEIKFDGYRVQFHIINDDIKVFTRRGNDWTKRFRKIANDAYLINVASAIIDGEVVVPGEDGTTDFSVLQNELKGNSDKLVMVAFDLLYLNGQDLRKLPLVERKAALQKLIAKTAIQYSDSFELEGQELFRHACKIGLEGIVSKVRDSTYPADRSRNWLKVTCAQRETLRIAGFALEGNKWDGIYIGREKAGKLIYAGKVDHGFTPQSEKELRSKLKPLVRKTQPYAKKIAHRGIWVEPSLLAEIEYRAKSAEGKVRHPFYKGLREDLE
jgi:bifunctional non-homologous end joining protein LigD